MITFPWSWNQEVGFGMEQCDYPFFAEIILLWLAKMVLGQLCISGLV